MERPDTLQQFMDLFAKKEEFRQAVFLAYAYAEKERQRHRLKSQRRYLRKKAEEANQPPKPKRRPGRPRKEKVEENATQTPQE